ncbi:MAG: hypothetical protein GY842_10580 [bacterium]|nr:hypothetical protein [bacterium]
MSRTPWSLLVLQFKISPAKSGVLGALALVLIVLLGRSLLRGPNSAGAAPVQELAGVDLLPSSAAGLEPIPTANRKACPPCPLLPREPVRDIFRADWTLFAHTRSVGEADVPVEEDEPTGEDALELTLELTLTTQATDGTPVAVISGERVQVGDVLRGFVIESIVPGRVVLVDRGGQRTSLLME